MIGHTLGHMQGCLVDQNSALLDMLYLTLGSGIGLPFLSPLSLGVLLGH